MTSAAIYARQSLAKDEGIDRQIRKCTTLIELKGWTVGATYKDNDTSASKARGPKTDWAKMLDEVQAGDILVAVDLDRLLRSTKDLLLLIEKGVRVLTVDGEIDLTTADGEYRATQAASLARFESRRKSERQKRANLDRAETGKANPGRRRYGFESDGITIRESEAEQVRILFQDFRDGASIRSLSMRMGWRPGRVRDILGNPAYSGRLRHKTSVYEVPGLVPVVNPEIAAEVAAMLKDPARRTTPGPAVKHLASGIAKCGVCGATMFYMRSYRCRVTSAHPSINKNILDPMIAWEVATILVTEPLSAWDKGKDTTALYAALSANLQKQQNYLDLMDAGTYTPAQVTNRTKPLKAEERSIREQIDQAKARTSTARILAELRGDLWQSHRFSFEDAADATQRIADEFLKIDIETQRELVRGLLSVTVNPGRAKSRVVIDRLEDDE